MILALKKMLEEKTAEVDMTKIYTDERVFIHDDDIDLLASDILIRGGRIDYSAVSMIRRFGYDVFPVEKDSFGWLIGGITLSDPAKSRIVFTFG